MEEFELLSGNTIQARVQRIRERMAIEKLSGVPATNREEFLAVCEAYEQHPLHAEHMLSVLRSGEVGNWKDWTDWSDWHKYHYRPIDVRR